jgi:cytochrome c-type biogenesis protein CcmE
MTKGVQIAIGATVIAGLLGWYGATNLDAAPAFTYYETLEDFQANANATSGARSRFHGYVAANSIRRDIDAMQVRFLVQNDPPHADDGSGAPIEVILESLETPDLFKDGAEVVVEGRMVASSAGPIFEADKIMAKCPSKFEAAPMGSTES